MVHNVFCVQKLSHYHCHQQNQMLLRQKQMMHRPATGADREMQQILLKLLNQMDSFDHCREAMSRSALSHMPNYLQCL